MATRSEIKPDEHGLALRIAMGAMRAANSASTARAGSVYIPNGDGTGTIIGELAGTDGTGGANGVAQWVGDTTPPGRPTGVSATSSWGIVYIRWDGTLEGGVPADFAYVSVTDGETELGRFTGAGCISVDGFDDGERLDLEFTAYDSAKDFDGTLRPNASGTAVVTVTVDNERTEIDAAVADANEKADALQGQMEDVTASVNGVEQEVGELTSKVEGAVEEAGAALTAATEAKQTATEVSSTAERAYEDAQSALSQASSAVQTATQLQQTVTEDYLSKDDAAGTYAAKSDVTQTADEIRQEVSETYVSKEDADSTFTTKTEFEQTTEGISASVSQAVATADGAMEKATTVEQTAEGLQVTLTEVEATANAAKKQVWHTAVGTTGTAGYIGIATIKITSTYANVPLYFEFTSRNKKATPVWIRFTSANSADPTLNSLTADGDANVYIRKTATSTWQVIVQKSEAYDQVSVTDFNNGGNYMNGKVTVTWTNTMLTSLPSGYIKATVLAGKRNSADIDNAAKTATNYLKFDSAGLCVGNMTGTLQGNTLITSSGVQIRNGSAVLMNITGTRTEMFSGGTSVMALVSDPAVRIGSNRGMNFYIDTSSLRFRKQGYDSLVVTSDGQGFSDLDSSQAISLNCGSNFCQVSNGGVAISTDNSSAHTFSDFALQRNKTGEWTWVTFSSGIRIAWLVHGGWAFKANAQTYTDFTLPWTAHNANYAVFYGLTNFASGSQPPGFTGAHFITTNATTTKFRANCWNDSNSAFTCGVAIMVLDRPWG